MDGSMKLPDFPINNEIFEMIFNGCDSYNELPTMLLKVANDVVRSDFDSIKEHAICYHMAGLCKVIYAAKEAFNLLNTECKILDINIEDQVDKNDFANICLMKQLSFESGFTRS